MAVTILVVDDSRTIRQQISFCLSREGFTVIDADDGSAGLEALRNNKIELVISDVNMANVGGLEMLTEIRKNAEWNSIPVIMLTTECSSEKVEAAKKIGASGWLVKPFRPDQLIGAVKKLTNKAA